MSSGEACETAIKQIHAQIAEVIREYDLILSDEQYEQAFREVHWNWFCTDSDDREILKPFWKRILRTRYINFF